MKKLQLIISGLAFCLAATAQSNVVQFDYHAKKISDKVYEIHILAKMNDGWHIYSKDQPKQAISQPTRITFNSSPLYALKGPIKENGDKKKYEDKVADIVQYQYGGQVEFVQTLTLKATVKSTITGHITYQACTDEQCQTPQTIPFEVSID
ncbi:protein-disulfide reductase DsbD domain-containing protein [Puia dinghuensis]|uniref:Thiol:disulfide interchange protein DsbD N-terminal domain-containing protein n=1 Tax=Puia dinghuensis TaxID=1792502 RepID=A0A8J2UHV3_9BACT|nr:protein-disulfide reductase DsbD domain-containing protein [Puia dinghuensis]GGB19755.1 hypothetical protein GCM10011511_49370 [Puia dinghuensis]